METQYYVQIFINTSEFSNKNSPSHDFMIFFFFVFFLQLRPGPNLNNNYAFPDIIVPLPQKCYSLAVAIIYSDLLTRISIIILPILSDFPTTEEGNTPTSASSAGKNDVHVTCLHKDDSHRV